MILSLNVKFKTLLSIIACLILLFTLVTANNDTSEEPIEEIIIEEPVDKEISPEENSVEELAEEESIIEELIVEETVSEIPEETNETEFIEEIIEEHINETIDNITEEIIENQTEEESIVEEPEPSLIKTILNLILDKISVIRGEIINIKAYLAYENETPVSGKQIDFYADDVSIGSEATDNSGLAEMDWDTSDFNEGIYTIKADYSEEGIFEGSFDSIEVDLTEEVEEVVLNETVEENLTEEILNETLIENLIILNETIINLTNETTEVVLLNKTRPELAEFVNGEPIDTPEIKKYFKLYKDFPDLKFKKVKSKDTIILKKGEFVSENIEGLDIDGEGYIIHVTYCDKFSDSCTLKINGVSTNRLYNSQIVDKSKQTEFSLDESSTIRINSITFDYCDEKRFCNYHFDAYNIIEIEVEG